MFPVRNNYKIYTFINQHNPFLEREFVRLSGEYLNKYSQFKGKSVKLNRRNIFMYVYILSDDRSKVRSMLVFDVRKIIIIRYLFGELNDFHYLIAKVISLTNKKLSYSFPYHKDILKIAKMHDFKIIKHEGSFISLIKDR